MSRKRKPFKAKMWAKCFIAGDGSAPSSPEFYATEKEARDTYKRSLVPHWYVVIPVSVREVSRSEMKKQREGILHSDKRGPRQAKRVASKRRGK